jgi:hypothetical protein
MEGTETPGWAEERARVLSPAKNLHPDISSFTIPKSQTLHRHFCEVTESRTRSLRNKHPYGVQAMTPSSLTNRR